MIGDTINVKVARNNDLQRLLHEVIKNDCLCDLVTFQYTDKKEQAKLCEDIKKQMNYNEKDENGGLILNDKILTILNELKILYHDDIHKQMRYPLQLHEICAILLYCGKSCNVQFNFYLCEALMILHKHERREESEIELYCGLKNVRLENIKEIKAGNFISHVSTSDDIQ
ncbi:hypothetical protein RFI_35482, partial [Reticulomyxa filosa]